MLTSKNKTLALGLSAVMLLSGAPMISAHAQTTAKVLKPGDAFVQKGISAGKKPYVLQVVNSDLNKDKSPDLLYLVGNKPEKDSPYYDQITYVLKDGKTNKWTATVLKDEGSYNLGGYDPKVTVSDLNGDGQNDLLLSAPTGGSGGMVSYKLNTLKSGKWVDLLSKKDLAGLTITGKYLDNFKIELYAKEIDTKFSIDLSANKTMLVETKTYDGTGKLLTPTEPWAGSLNNLEITEAYGMKMIKAEQRIVGIANADTVGRVELMLHFEKGAWQIKTVELVTPLKYNL